MNGQLAVPFNDILNPVLEGKNSFTIEVNMTPGEARITTCLQVKEIMHLLFVPEKKAK